MSTAYATVDDLIALWRPLTADETTRAEALLPLLSDELRVYARKVNKDLDAMVEADEAYANTVKVVTVDSTARVLRQDTEGDAMTQESMSGLGYSWQGTYAVPGGGISGAIMKNDLKRLGLLTQQVGSVFLWDGSGE